MSASTVVDSRLVATEKSLEPSAFVIVTEVHRKSRQLTNKTHSLSFGIRSDTGTTMSIEYSRACIRLHSLWCNTLSHWQPV